MCQSAVFSPLVSGESFTLCGAATIPLNLNEKPAARTG